MRHFLNTLHTFQVWLRIKQTPTDTNVWSTSQKKRLFTGNKGSKFRLKFKMKAEFRFSCFLDLHFIPHLVQQMTLCDVHSNNHPWRVNLTRSARGRELKDKHQYAKRLSCNKSFHDVFHVFIKMSELMSKVRPRRTHKAQSNRTKCWVLSDQRSKTQKDSSDVKVRVFTPSCELRACWSMM